MYRYILPLLLFVILLGSCDHPKQAVIASAPLISEHFTDDVNREVTLAQVPQKVISLAPNITEMIYAIGGEDKLIARSQVCDYPEAVLYLPEVSAYPSIDLPAIARMEPDLVLASSEIHNPIIHDYFDRLNLNLFFQSYETFDDIYRNIKVLGEMLHITEAANQLVDSLSHMEQLISDSTANQIKYKTVIIMGVEPIIVAGGGSFLNEMLAKAGGKNAFANVEERYPEITAEQLVKAAPEYLLFPTKNDQMYAELIARYPDLHTLLPAALNKHVFVVEPSITVRPGPRIIEGLVALVRLLHPRIDLTDLFPE
ncbi:MAG TPA: hypothetical protein ENJ82_00640 [Bacteroidetes bacterium]|nr:hypothetical protein [Bacteroidota bacterium]